MADHPMPRTSPTVLVPVDAPDFRPADMNRLIVFTVFKWSRLILAMGVALAIGTAIALYLQPPRGSATARILVKPDRALQLSGLRAGGRGDSPSDLLQTEMEFLASRAVLVPAARSLRAERQERRSAAAAGSAADAPASDDAGLARDVRTLRDNLGVLPVPHTTIIEAKYTTRSAEDAERALRHIIDNYVEQRGVIYIGTESLTEFYERETAKAAAELSQAEERLARWQQDNNVVAVHDQISTQLRTLGDLEAGFLRTEAELDATRARIDTLTAELTTLPTQAVTSRVRVPNPLVARLKTELAAAEAMVQDDRRNPVVGRLRADLVAAELALKEGPTGPLVERLRADLVTADLALHDLRQRYTDEDRRVREKLDQIAQVKRQLADEESASVAASRARLEALRRELAAAEAAVDRAARERIATLRTQLADAEREGEIVGRETVALNPLRQSLTQDLGSARALLTSLVSRRDSHRGQLQEATRMLAGLREKRVHADRLGREVELARTAYMQHAKRLDDARLAAGLERNQLANIAIIEPPHATGTRSGFRFQLVVLAGLVGLGLGAAAAFGKEFLNASLRTREDVEFYLRLPVIAAVPALSDRTPSVALAPLFDQPGRAEGQR
jgi:uncharacterized protein involved in exopolysaccharide biosynthesis